MSREQENKSVVRRFIEELWNGRNLSVAHEIFATECVTHQLSSGSEISTAPRDPATLKNHVKDWLYAFPDLHFEIEQTIAAGDRVVSQLVMRGTHKNAWSGIPATHKHVSIRMVTIHRIEGGRIVEDWVMVESLGFFQQLGLVPSMNELFQKPSS